MVGPEGGSNPNGAGFDTPAGIQTLPGIVVDCAPQVLDAESIPGSFETGISTASPWDAQAARGTESLERSLAISDQVNDQS